MVPNSRIATAYSGLEQPHGEPYRTNFNALTAHVLETDLHPRCLLYRTSTVILEETRLRTKGTVLVFFFIIRKVTLRHYLAYFPKILEALDLSLMTDGTVEHFRVMSNPFSGLLPTAAPSLVPCTKCEIKFYERERKARSH